MQRAKVSPCDVRFKVVETSGASLKSVFHRSDPWAGQNCNRSDCFPCKMEKGGNCSRSGITYQIVCLTCGTNGVVVHYKGESGRNMFTRGKEHLSLLNAKSIKSPLWKHCLEHHNGQMAEFKMEITGQFQTPLQRQIMEGIQITNFNGDLPNGKSKWRQPADASVKP